MRNLLDRPGLSKMISFDNSKRVLLSIVDRSLVVLIEFVVFWSSVEVGLGCRESSHRVRVQEMIARLIR